MTACVQGLLKKYNVKTLKELSKKLKISLDKVKNISSGRTSRKVLFIERSQYRVFPERSKILAELIGVTPGDGNIFQFKRCQRLTISCNSSYKAYTEHVRDLVRGVLKKEPSVLN